MSYLPVDALLGEPEPWERPFWDFCRDRSLRFQACSDCDSVRHPPMPFCPACRSAKHDWRVAGDDAELFTYTIVHHASHAALTRATPYNAAVVMFPSMQSVRLVSNIVDCPDEDLKIGMPLSLVWEEPTPGVVLARFQPRAGG
jgi:uncharacterized OB-fold protein